MSRAAADRSSLQTVKAQLRLRELILSGNLRPGERVAELSLVELLGVSRTPVRVALVRLAEEGLLEPIATGGFSVRGFSRQDIVDAIEIRGALEGLAARMAAERGAPKGVLEEMADCVEEMDVVLQRSDDAGDDFSDYVRLNARFHTLLHDAAMSITLQRQIERVCAMPFASPSGFAVAQSRYIQTIAQDQHREIYMAIRDREGARAEALAREHARLARRHMDALLQAGSSRELPPGMTLIDEPEPRTR